MNQVIAHSPEQIKSITDYAQSLIELKRNHLPLTDTVEKKFLGVFKYDDIIPIWENIDFYKSHVAFVVFDWDEDYSVHFSQFGDFILRVGRALLNDPTVTLEDGDINQYRQLMKIIKEYEEAQ